MTLAIAEGSGDGWFGLGLVVASAQLILQILANAGKVRAGWPAISATTPSGKVASVGVAAALVIFCIVGLITTE